MNSNGAASWEPDILNTPHSLQSYAGEKDIFRELHARGILEKILEDKTTGKNIIWATDTYADLGAGFAGPHAITTELICGKHDLLASIRSQKRLARTRKHGEVFTPLPVCEKMCAFACDALKTTDWQKFIAAKVLEITCGEAPFLTARRDQASGEIVPLFARCGILDTKLRLVNENTETKKDWLNWTLQAFQTTYGYEFQGDNLIQARLNLLAAFEENYQTKWQINPNDDEYERILEIIAWNVWQMDGLTGTLPYGKINVKKQGRLLPEADRPQETPLCLIKNWQNNKSTPYLARNNAMKFGFIIGNPPYQEEMAGTSDNPVYNHFMDGAYKLADKVELITPARFLFNAGKTPKEWNRKMLSDPHLQVLEYWPDSAEVFQGYDITGGLVVTYRDINKNSGPLTNFIPENILAGMVKKVISKKFKSLAKSVYAPESYKFNDLLHQDYPNLVEKLSASHKYDLTTNIFNKLKEIFTDINPNKDSYAGILGRESNTRTIKWILKKYISFHPNLNYYKIAVPKSNGSPTLSSNLSTPVIGSPELLVPGTGHNQTFISIGAFETEQEAKNCLKYIKTRFARAMLGTLKVTQDNKKGVWKNVPIQDFTPNSDIDWSKSIPEIDRQLYAKYGLDDKEIEFIETHVKEME